VKIHHTALGALPAPIVDVGTGAHADSFTLIIGGVDAAAVPEPSGLPQLGGRPRRAGVGGHLAQTAPELIALWRGRERPPPFSGLGEPVGLAGLAHSGTGANR